MKYPDTSGWWVGSRRGCTARTTNVPHMTKKISGLTEAQHVPDDGFESLGALGQLRLAALCEALGLGAAGQLEASSLFSSISESWAQSRLGTDPPFPNDITDDRTPFEFSVGFESETPELRLLFESRLAGNAPSIRSSWEAGLNLQRQLRQNSLIDTTRFEQVSPLFAPPANLDGASVRFALWHAVALRRTAPPLFKAYVNPEVQGIGSAPALVSEAFQRLNMSACSSFVQDRLAHDTRILYFSLDLEASREARVKVYLSADRADSVEALVQGSGNCPAHAARGWLQTLAPDKDQFAERPILVCLAFSGNNPTPKATVHVPIRCCVASDEVALQRTVPLLPERSARQLERAMRAVAARPLTESKGVLTYVSLRPLGDRDQVRVTTYLAPCAYSPTSVSHRPSTMTFAKVAGDS